jgi:hypothetical protein
MRKTSSLNRAVVLAGAAALFAGMSLPGHAQSRSGPDGGSSSPAAAPAERNDGDAATRMICVRFELTASRVQRRICRTEAEWRARGEVPGEDSPRR